MLGTNGGGFFNVNSAHPFENPNKFSDFLELYVILIIPFALAFTFGRMVKDKRQGYAVVRGHGRALARRQRRAPCSSRSGGNPKLDAQGVTQTVTAHLTGRQRSRARSCGSAPTASGSVVRVDHRHVERLGQLDARQLHAGRRAGAPWST